MVVEVHECLSEEREVEIVALMMPKFLQNTEVALLLRRNLPECDLKTSITKAYTYSSQPMMIDPMRLPDLDTHLDEC